MQELKTMNIDMKIITEDNVEQLTSMSYSNNYKKLSHQDKDLREIVNNTIEKSNKLNVEGRDRKYAKRATSKEPAVDYIEEIFRKYNLLKEDGSAPNMMGWNAKPVLAGEEQEARYELPKDKPTYMYNALTLNDEGKPTDNWFIDNRPVNHRPLGWIQYDIDEAVKNSGRDIPDINEHVHDGLIKLQIPNNFNIVLSMIANGIMPLDYNEQALNKMAKEYTFGPPAYSQERVNALADNKPEDVKEYLEYKERYRKFNTQNDEVSPVFDPNASTPPFIPQTPSGTPPLTPSGTPPLTPDMPPPPPRYQPVSPDMPPPPRRYQPVSPFSSDASSSPSQNGGGGITLVPVPVAYMPISTQQMQEPIIHQQPTYEPAVEEVDIEPNTIAIHKRENNSLLIPDTTQKNTSDESKSEKSESEVKTISIN
jgi:hypothetical protein